mgnify:CR=1 FL=1
MQYDVRWQNRDMGFNRYMVECEFYNYDSNIRRTNVLIDTWWNVNVFFRRLIGCNTGFNRYMVECE